MVRLIVFGAALLASASFQVSAQEKQTRIGDWYFIVQKDNFSDTAPVKIIAMVMQKNEALAVRCMDGTMTIALSGGLVQRFTIGDMIEVKARTDSNPVIDTTAAAINPSTLEIVTPRHLVQEMLTAKEIALRVNNNGALSDSVFRLSKSTAKAIEPVMAACKE
jgi:uncharacterized protein YqfB (UPF0267 family)